MEQLLHGEYLLERLHVDCGAALPTDKPLVSRPQLRLPAQTTFCLIPKIFDPVDMIGSTSKQLAVIHTKVFEFTHIKSTAILFNNIIIPYSEMIL